MSIPVAVDHSAHAVYAPSSAHRWTRCTASAEAIARMPPQEEGEAAKEGTIAHDEIERCLGALNNMPIVGGGDFLALTDVVSSAHASAYGIALVLDFARQLAELTPGRFWIEQRVRLTDQIWGRCDVSHWYESAGVLTIVDYKNGMRAVDVEENEQTRIYAAAAIKTFGIAVKYIRYVIVQPNDWRSFVPRVKQWIEPTQPGLPVDPSWEKPKEPFWEFVPRVTAIPTSLQSFTAGEQCRDCPLFGKCDASLDMLQNLGAVMSGVVQPVDVRPEQVAQFLACRKPIEDQFKAFEKFWQTSSLKQNQPPPDMKFVTAQTKRAWVDVAAARKAVVEKLGVDALEPPTPAQAEKLGLDVSKLSAAPEGGPVLAFESDRRKAWAPKSAADMFGDLVGAPLSEADKAIAVINMMHRQPDGTYIESPLHGWFGLSYASYFVAPRLALESLPVDWQNRFIALIEEAQSVLGETPDYHVLRDDPEYTLVEKYDSEDETSRDYIFTAVRTDPWADYRRGDVAALIAEIGQ